MLLLDYLMLLLTVIQIMLDYLSCERCCDDKAVREYKTEFRKYCVQNLDFTISTATG